MDTHTVGNYIEQQLALRQHEFTEWSDIIKRIPTDPNLEGAYFGSYSLTLANRQKTYVGTHHTWCKKPASASSVSRLILKSGLKLLGRKRIYWNMASRPLLDIPQPLYCKPIEFGGRLTYVDIAGAYYSIYSRLPFDLRFQGLRIYGGGIWFRDFLPADLYQHKTLRNALVGCLRQLTQARIKGGKMDVKQNRNVYLAPEHWGFMAHLLHTIAHSALDCGATYYNTDGAIFQHDESAIKWAQQLTDWGFTPNIKLQGSGYVHSIGHYKIAETAGGCLNSKPMEFNNLIDTSPYVLKRWLQWA